MSSAMVGGRSEQPVGRRYRHRAVLRMASVAGALCAGVLGVLSGCAGMIGTHDVDISESQLTVLMARQFPMERKVMEVIDLNITNPVLTLMPQANRVGTELDVTAIDRLFGSTALGHVKLDYGLRFQPSDHTIRMTQVRVRELALSSGSSNLHGAAQRIGGLVAENALENLVLYRMKPAQADEMDRLNLVASPITVTPTGLHMSVSPKQG
ncbi:hypothetical protein [Scleromatobacter humisilvae]|uniref:DUF1439 domain-containing protein n=1 Tax=Scleromatobacter humisilvae TaxID=2897159 RepID=A0A9X1YKY4_9BURK|nr:hypothetical protein [Scleromatobacter humisilvae]MCK9686653.1 hypothetical protein [Scleromatobacter humisilvae]